MADDLGLGIDLFQPFRDFEGMPDDAFRKQPGPRRAQVRPDAGARRAADAGLLEHLAAGASTIPTRAAAQLHALAERAARRNLRIGYEALAWGRHVRLYGQAWKIVAAPTIRTSASSSTASTRSRCRTTPPASPRFPGERIFFLQMADAPLLAMDVLQWARHHRNFPGQGQFDLRELLSRRCCSSGYAGPLSLEIFNDQFRETPNRRTAVDAMRSLLFLESQVRGRLERERDAAAEARRASSRRARCSASRSSTRRARRPSTASPSSSSASTTRPPRRSARCSCSSASRRAGRHRTKAVDAVPAGRHPARRQRRAGVAGARPLRRAGAGGLRHRPGDERPAAGGQPRRRAAFGAAREPARRPRAAAAGDHRARRHHRPLRARRPAARRSMPTSSPSRAARRRPTPASSRSTTSRSASPPTSSTPGSCSPRRCSACSAAKASSSPTPSA